MNGKEQRQTPFANSTPTSPLETEMTIVVSKKEAYHQFGNSVALPVVKALAKQINEQLLKKSK